MGVPTSLRNTQVIRFSPTGLSDSLDATDEFPGACAILSDLVPDPSTRNLWTPRPASVLLNAFGSFTTPGFISVFKVIGNYVYGMIASGLNAGKDQPFCYNLALNAFVSVSGITAANTPTSPLTTGDWTPPTMDLCGVNLVVTHPGFDGVTYFFGWFDLTNPAAPAWNAGNTAAGSAITLSTIPDWVVQFNGRAFLGINPATGQPSVVMTDSLTLKVTNAGQALTFGDNSKLTAAAPMPLSNQLGGIIQSLMVFKDSSNIIQVTGDYSSSNITINTLNVATGTVAPRSICRTPLGLMFVSPLGLRLIDQSATVSDPIGIAGKGVTVPFIEAITPTRMCAACNASVVRISLQSGTISGNPWVEYWYDIPRKVWSGPHSFPSSMIDVYEDIFIIAPQSTVATLFSGLTAPTPSSGSVENGTQLSWVMQSTMLQDNGQMAQSELTEMQLVCGGGAISNNSLNIVLQDSNGSVINQALLNFQASSTVWGTATWGSSVWGGPQGIYPYRIDFPSPTIYNRAAVRVTGVSTNGFRIGDTWLRRRILGYVAA